MEKEYNIAIIGLGYVGLPLALAFSEYYKVVGYDIDEKRILELNKGLDNNSNIDFSRYSNLMFSSREHDIESCNIYIVTVPTPVDNKNNPDLSALKSASSIIGSLLKKGDIVIYESTVYPGVTEEVCVPILQDNTELIFNKEFYCGYSPERISPGDKKYKLETIVKITSGSTNKIAEEIDVLYKNIIKAGTYKASSIKVAEAAKVVENTQRDVNIALMNELAMMFDKMNIRTLEVLEAAQTKWNFLDFKPGLVGGHCIGVDPYYLTHKAKELGYHAQIINSGRAVNDSMGAYVGRTVAKKIIASGTPMQEARVLVMGATFKEDVSDIRNSKVVDVINELKSFSCHVEVVDPHANSDELMEEYGFDLVAKTSGIYHSVIVAVNHQEYTLLDENYFVSILSEKGVLVDLKGIFRNKIQKLNYWTL